MIGKTISHYRILERLGAGGMGVVYKAEDTKLGRTVALKFLPPDLTREQSAKTRFIHEARAASALQHHNICTIHEIDETPEGQLFISMDCYQGETLKERIARGPLSVEEAVDIASQVAAGLSKAHEAGMVHRDIKPANIMVTTDGVVKLLDFGLAKLAGMTKLTKTGTTVGTVSYMSPEQARGEEVDARSDIFSLGAVFYEMLTGTAPFPGDHEAAVLYGIMHTDPKPLAEADKSLPQELQGIVDKTLKKDPKERYQNVLDLRDDLETVDAEEGAGKKRRRRPRRLPGAAKKARTRRRIAVGAAAAAVLAVVGLLLGPRMWRSIQVEPAHALAVMDFRDLATPDDPTVSAGLTEFTNIGFIQADLVRVVSSDLLHDLRRRLFGSPRGAIEESQTIEIARQAGATLFLTGTIRSSSAGLLVTWHLVDVQTGDDVKAGRVEGRELAPLVDRMITDALPSIARKCGVEAKGAPTGVENITTDSQPAFQHYMAGLLAQQEWRNEDAIVEFERAVALDSTFALAYLDLGEEYLHYFSAEKVHSCLEKAWIFRSRLGIKDQMRLEAARLNTLGLGNSEYDIGKSIAILREMRTRWPDDRQILIDLRDLVGMRWYDVEALQITEDGLRLYPDDPVLGGAEYQHLLVNAGRTDEAVRAARSNAVRHPNQPSSWAELARIYIDSGAPDSAEAATRKALELDPRWDPYKEFPIRIAYTRGDLARATSTAEEILEKANLSPEMRRALVLFSFQSPCVASLYIEAGRYRKMREVCEEYWALPEMDWPQFFLLTAMGQWQEIVDVTRRYNELAKTDGSLAPRYPLHYGRALVELGDVEGGRTVAKQLLEDESKIGGMAVHDAKDIEARAALSEKNPKKALEILLDMRKNGVPSGGYIDIFYRTTLARAYRMDGRLEEAAETHQVLLKIYGGHALSHYELGTIYEEMKRPTDAKREYAEFLDMWSQADEDLPQLIDARRRLAAL